MKLIASTDTDLPEYLQIGVVEPVVNALVALKLFDVPRNVKCTCWHICLTSKQTESVTTTTDSIP